MRDEKDSPSSSSSSLSSSQAGSQGLSSLFSSLSPTDRYIALQAASSALAGRFQFSRSTGYGWDAFDGLRDYFTALGFKRELTISDYRQRYERGGIAKVLIDRLPEEMWDDGVFIEEEEEDPQKPSEFKVKATQFWEKHSVESRLMKADKLAGLSIYSVILIGVKETGSGPVNYSLPLPKLNGPDDIIYLLQYAEDNAKVVSLIKDPSNPRFCQPEFYELKSASPNAVSSSGGVQTVSSSEVIPRVHWTRIIHVAHGLLESDWVGTPDLQASWNDLESLYKVAWGGPEAAWRKMDMGIQWDLDPEYDHKAEDLKKMDEQIEDMRHLQKRDIKTSGVKANPLAGTVDKYGPNVESNVKLVAGTHCLPYTLLLGEELGLRAGENNRETINIVTQGRRKQFGTPLVRQLLDRLIEFGGLPKPKGKDGKYKVIWGVEEELGESEKAELGKSYAEANLAQHNAGGGILWTTDEIRDKVGDDPLEVEEEEENMGDGDKTDPATDSDPMDPEADIPIDSPVSTPDLGKLAKMVEWFEKEMVK